MWFNRTKRHSIANYLLFLFGFRVRRRCALDMTGQYMLFIYSIDAYTFHILLRMQPAG